MTEQIAASQYLVAYFHSMGRGRTFATLDRGGVPCGLDIKNWEARVERNMGLHQVGITSFQLIDKPPSDACAETQPASVARIPAGLYAELEALRTLRDATGVYLQGYMLDEIEDEDNCVTVDQHDAACSVKAALDSARALEWKGGDK
ncbi:hypothetical protein N619_01170 [Ectopseudomonas oleovorans]|nr:hypothetical protein N619_01170 [Pseudomonas oleovorans]